MKGVGASQLPAPFESVGGLKSTLRPVALKAVTTHTFNNTHTVRVVTIDGEPWFVAKGVCDALGLENASNACRIHDTAEKMVVTPTTYRDLFSLGRGSSRLILVSESGLYKLIMRSDKLGAKVFQDWVTKEVLPSIRKTGSYTMQPGEVMPLPVSFAEAMRQALFKPEGADFVGLQPAWNLAYISMQWN